MAGSKLAKIIDKEYKMKMAFKNKKMKKCRIDIKKECDKCKYKPICEINRASKQGK